MATQLRRYRIKPGALDQFVGEWSSGVLPLREQHGFVLRGAWTIPETSEFVWVIEHPDFEEADRAYYRSPGREALDPDPAVHVERAQHLQAEEVGSP